MLIIRSKKRKSLSNGFTLCFPHIYVNAIFQSIFHKFLSRFTQNLFTRIICSLLVGIDCVTDNSKVG